MTEATLFPELPPLPPATLHQLIEGVLFVAGEPVTISQLAQSLELPADAIEQGLETLQQHLSGHGMRLQRHGDHVQLVSAPEVAAAVARFLGGPVSQRLSAAALEVLAIIAYRQPLTKAQVESIRGVDSSGVIRALLARELIAEVGRLETIGRPILYGVTDEFMRQFGLSSLNDLPPLDLPEPSIAEG